MPSPTPAVRSALVGFVVVTLAVAAGAALHLAARERQAHEATDAALGAHASTLAAALAAEAGQPPSAAQAARAFGPLASAGDDVARVLVDDAGRVVGATDAGLGRAVDWAVAARRGTDGRPVDVAVGDVPYRAAVRPVGSTGLSVAAVRPATALPARDVQETLAWALALWGLLAGALAVRAWADGPRVAARLTAFGERIAQGETDPDTMRRTSRGLGTLAGAFAPVAARLRKEATERAELREHVAALYQVNPHYVVLCTLDGRVVEANPAFYAVTGMPIEAVRGGRIEALTDVFPIEPLMDLARRSLAEGASIGGIDYGIVGADDDPRPVEVSLRAFHAGGTDVVVIQATDVAVRRRLERRVEAFSDTLDLMVDQRVAQLTAGQQSLRRILDAAGVAVASFDAGGGTRRWSGGARALTGRTAQDVPHFVSVAAALGFSDADRAAFTAWFWNPGDAPFLGRHTFADASGQTRTVQIVWHKVEAD
ncbi:MAG TPA: PAS domain-containing protein, partial [Rubricoccaceae bacterium]